MTRPLAWALLPLLLIALVTAGFLALDPLRAFRNAVPPIERLTIERTKLDGEGIGLSVRAGGSEPVSLAQVQVDGAYWKFAQQPPGPIPRLGTAWISIPYPWVFGETHHLVFVSRTGVSFEHTIDVAVATPEPTGSMLRGYALVGLGVGVLPVALGMLFFPALKAGGTKFLTFALALTIGLLAFLLVDTMEEALEIAANAAPELQAPALVWLVAGLAFGILFAAGRWQGRELRGYRLATAIALGIGFHNLGEGLAIGAAFTTGAAALGTFLVLGFTLHNITEGIGIVAPLLRDPPRLPIFMGLALLAGLPAVPGVWLGAFAFSAHWAALALAVGAGAILQVIIEVTLLLTREMRRDGASWRPAQTLAGLALGIGVMYGTALLVPV